MWTPHFHLLLFDVDQLHSPPSRRSARRTELVAPSANPRNLTIRSSKSPTSRSLAPFAEPAHSTLAGRGGHIQCSQHKSPHLRAGRIPTNSKTSCFSRDFVVTPIELCPRRPRDYGALRTNARGESAIATTWRSGDALLARAGKTCRRPAFNLLSALGNSPTNGRLHDTVKRPRTLPDIYRRQNSTLSIVCSGTCCRDLRDDHSHC